MAIQKCSSVTLNSIAGECEVGSGGIKRILIGRKEDVTGVTFTEGDVPVISALTRTADTKFEQWTFRPETGAYTSTLTADRTTGVQYWSTVVTLQFTKVEAEKRLYIQNALNAGAVICIEDFNGSKVYLGYDEAVYGTNGTMVSGTARGDLNGFTVEFTDTSKEMPYLFADDFDLDALLVAGA